MRNATYPLAATLLAANSRFAELLISPRRGLTRYSPAVTGDLRLHTFTSKTFGNTRKLRGVLPPDGYDDLANRGKRYAVLYLADGHNLFDPATGVFGPRDLMSTRCSRTTMSSTHSDPADDRRGRG